ncbi:MAG: fumarylacetoacetate hydrolase family protein [Pseudomonadota bacterium]
MRLLTFSQGDDPQPGVLVDGGSAIVGLGRDAGRLEHWLGCAPETIEAATAASREAWKPVPLADVRLHAPILRPGKILGIGLNYQEHAAESVSFVKADAGGVQKWFNKQATAANGPFDPVALPAVSDQLDYEAELVVVIGKRGRHVPADRAMEIIAGYTCGCDYSVRDWQRASPTMIMGKGFDTHAPFGPWIVTPDEMPPLDQVGIRSFVNGVPRQNGRAGQMIHAVPEQIAHLSAAFTLEPGDVIFTGTPAGVGAAMDPPTFLSVGDRVRVEVDGIGAIENEIAAEDAKARIGDDG